MVTFWVGGAGSVAAVGTVFCPERDFGGGDGVF